MHQTGTAVKTPNGFILYQGPSMLDGQPIVAIATGLGRRSKNAKTGDMVQTYIIRQDADPITASRQGTDSSVCGDCKHRPVNGGSCYVTLAHGPLAVFKAYKRDSYPVAQDAQAIEAIGKGRMVRLGTYGDPAAVPVWVWQALVASAQGHTGYTHQWRYPSTEMAQHLALKALVMASADSPREAQEAQADGWRTFRVRLADESLAPREFVCPASEEAGKRTDCASCGACSGTKGPGDRRASPVIVAHGSGKLSKFIAIRSA
jgi:hypothetical protein